MADNPGFDDVHALAQRVAQLERQVEALNAAIGPPQAATIAAHPAPPPLPQAPAMPTFAIVPEPPAISLPVVSLEDRLGSQLFSLIGIVALIFGSAWALKLAIDEHWIGETSRVLLGLAAGAGLILWSEVFRRKSLAAFAYALKAVGTGVLYLTLWAGFQLYHLLPAPAALALMILVTAWNAFMAFTQDSELLAAYALAGAYLTPLLLSTGGDRETFLFTYLSAIAAGTVALLRAKPWPRLLVPTWIATAVYFSGYCFEWFHRSQIAAWDTQSTETALFALLFFALFALVSTPFSKNGGQTGIVAPVLIPLANAAFLAMALYAIFDVSGLHAWLAWLMAALAALYLGLMRVQKTSLAAAMHLAAGVVCLTAAVPLKTHGHSLTIAWLIEGIVLFWASTRISPPEIVNLGAPDLAPETWDRPSAPPSRTRSRAPQLVLRLLSLAGYTLGLASVLAHWTWTIAFDERLSFFTADLASALIAAATLAGAAWLSRPSTPPASPAILIAALSAIDGVAILLALAAFTRENGGLRILAQTAFFNSSFATSLIGLALLAATTWAAWRSFRADSTHFRLLGPTAACDLILFNLTALLLVWHEIGALFPPASTSPDAALQRSLTVSAFLMLYAAILLAAGFWRRNAFVRWQALGLILFTIAKVFLSDISGLSAGYRVVSFLALGALLMAVSFAYQRDWLGLKSTPGEAPQ